MNTVLKYPGAKNRIAKWICGYIPHHNVYLEPYAGSLAVLFNKQPCHIETVNDLHDEVVNYFKVIRDMSEEFIKLVNFTPYSRTEYELAFEKSDDNLCRHSHNRELTQDDLDEICDKCKVTELMKSVACKQKVPYQKPDLHQND